ncbi:MAG: hypothetical protein JXR94_09075 [Candidatus Hydrogenedentes bacterium]|nr:hypothetical protein [Candidatus Hydrogenedentota bacterium]
MDGESITATYPDMARNWIDPSATYDVAHLPFLVRFDTATILRDAECNDVLELSGPEGADTVPVTPGRTVVIGENRLQVDAVRPWAGLASNPQGLPMAELSLLRGPDGREERVFVHAGAWLRVDERTALLHRRFDSEDALEAALGQGLPGAESARWGVIEDGQVQWIESLLPGCGVELESGLQATLLEFEPSHEDSEGRTGPAIRVEVAGAGGERVAWFFANAHGDDEPIRFDYPSRLERVFLVYAWQDRQATVAAFRNGAFWGCTTLAAGETWMLEEGALSLRLDDALAAAFPVGSDESGVFEAVLTDAGRQWRFREGETVRLDNTLVRFARTGRPPEVCYGMTLADPDDGALARFSLTPGDGFEFDGWHFAQAPAHRRAEDLAVLNVERSADTASPLWGVGVAAAGLCGIVLSRRFGRRPRA